MLPSPAHIGFRRKPSALALWMCLLACTNFFRILLLYRNPRIPSLARVSVGAINERRLPSISLARSAYFGVIDRIFDKKYKIIYFVLFRVRFLALDRIWNVIARITCNGLLE